MTTVNGRPRRGAAVGVNVADDSTSVLRGGDKRGTSSDCLSAALQYASVGVGVFPLGATKRPLARCTQCRSAGGCPGRDECLCPVTTCHAFYAATTEPSQIVKWWRQHPSWNVGVRTGRDSGLVVLDVDVDKGGLESLLALQCDGLSVDGAAVQLSGSGLSFHLIYGHPGVRVPCSQGLLGAGLDVRGDGGYVVGAPSTHPDTGARYELLGDLTGLPVWPLPTPEPRHMNRDNVCPPARGGAAGGSLTSARLDALIDRVRRAPVGQRRSTLFWAACRLGECAGRQDDLVTAAGGLLLAGQSSGLDPGEVYATVLDGVREGRRR